MANLKHQAARAIHDAQGVLDTEYDSNDEEIGDLRDNLDLVIGLLERATGLAPS